MLFSALESQAVHATPMPPPPASPVARHEPALRTCTSDNLLQTWKQQLQAYSDQPPAVLERLRLVQRDLAIVTINRCIQRGLLSRGDARQLAIQMGLETGTPEAQAPSQRP